MPSAIKPFDVCDIVAKISDSIHRIAKIMFHRDGSIYVFFPGFAHSEGILSKIRIRGGSPGAINADLTETGRVTSHLVKYAHHPDGEAHFSQDGKVKTEIRRKSVPLAEQDGHLFTIMIQDLQSFSQLKSSRKKQITIDLQSPIRALKIIGHRLPAAGFDIPEGTDILAKPAVQFSDGALRVGIAIAPPDNGHYPDKALFITVDEIPWFSEDRAAQLIFLGAFDTAKVGLNHAVDTEFLAFAYPCSDYNRLAETIGSIDLQ